MNTPEYKAKASASRRGVPWSARAHKNIKEGIRRSTYRHSAETIAKIVATRRGRYENDPAYRERLAEAQRGRKASPATRALMSISASRAAGTTSNRARVSRQFKGKHLSPEHRAKISAANRGRKRSEDSRRRMSAAQTQSILLKHRLPSRRGIIGRFFSNKCKSYMSFRSILEKNWYQRAEGDGHVTSYKPEPFAIRYNFKGGSHAYIPDMLVRFDDGVFFLLEIKPENRIRESPINTVKWIAAKALCSQCFRPTRFRVVGYTELRSIDGGASIRSALENQEGG